MLYITRQVKFSASHRLYNPMLSDEENKQLYDKCSNPNGHGHNYILEVTLAGKPDEISGYVYDLKKLKHILYTEIINKVDHKNLNLDVDFLIGINPTVENLVQTFWRMLIGKFAPAELYRIKLYETETSYVEYFGE